MTRIVTAVLALFLTVGAAFGQQCATPGRVVYGPTTTYHAPVHKQVVEKVIVKEVAAPIAVPVLVPATVFQYLPALQPAAAVPVAATPVAPAAPQAPAATPDIDAIVRARVDAILRERSGDKGPPTLILPGELPKGPEQPAASAPPAAPQGDLNSQVANMLASKSCVQCHTQGDGRPVKGNVTLFVKKDGQMFFQPSASKKQILDSVTPDSSGKAAMPPSGPALAANEVNLLRQWEAQR